MLTSTATIRSAFLFMVVTVASPATAMVTTPCDAAPAATFVPNWGQTYVGEDFVSRYVEQTFYWDTDSRLAWLMWTSESTFELKTYFYNYNRDAWAMEPSGFWESNLPYPYVDTQAFDSPIGSPPDEMSTTIGSALASEITAGVYYYVTRVTSGPGTLAPNAAGRLVKVSVFRGRRVPSACTSTFCAFLCDSADNGIKVIPYQSNMFAPGCRSWWYQWYASLDLACQYP